MAKIFGYSSNSLSRYSKSDLVKMENAFRVNFQSQAFIKNKRGELGVGVLNKYDCQPVVLKTKTTKLMFMGKIFNTKEKVNSLFKAILKSIETDNNKLFMKLLRDINGIFLMVIYDSKKDKTYIINDRYAMEPLYYFCNSGQLVFASEIKAVISHGSIKRVINWEYWKDFFQYGYSMGDKTPFENIFYLPNASILSFQNGRSQILKYWDYSEINISDKLNLEAVINLGVKVLKNVFRRQSTDLRKCIVFLSGGYDSRSIACSLKNFTKISFENISSNLHPSTGELDYILAKNVSNKLHIKNHFVGRPEEMYKKYFSDHFLQLDGLCTEHKWVLPLVDSLKEELPNFDGIGADVMLRVPFLARNIIDEYDNEKLTTYFNKQIVEKARRNRCKFIYKYFDSPFSVMLKPDSDSIYNEFKNIDNVSNKVIIFYLKNRTKNSISILARNLIGRKIYSYFPFFDNEFVEFSLSILPRMKFFDHVYPKILKKAFPDAMKIPTTNDAPVKKQLAIIRENISTEILVNPNTSTDGDLNYLFTLVETLSVPSFLKRKMLLSQVEKDIKKGVDVKKYLVSVLQFCIWYKEYRPYVF